MNTAYILAIIWGLLALLALMFTNGQKNYVIVALLTTAAALSGILGIVIQYGLLS